MPFPSCTPLPNVLEEFGEGQEEVRFDCRRHFPEREVAVGNTIVELLPIGIIFDSSIEVGAIVTVNAISISTDEGAVCSCEHLEFRVVGV